MANKGTIFSGLNDIFFGKSVPSEFKKTTTYDIGGSSPVIYSTDSKEDYEQKKLQLKQQKLLAYQWIKAGNDNMQDSLAGLTNVKLMYRDADLMCSDTYISSALETIADEACCVSSKGKMLNIYSKSERIKAILEDLFVNRLDVNTILPAICYNMMKYGNEYMLLNIHSNEGIVGWRELQPYDMERYEAGMDSPYSQPMSLNPNDVFRPEDVKFVRVGKNESNPYRSWQVAHFRNLTDTFFLPYGVSMLHKVRRAWRMLSMMEDSMLIYRLDKSVERRVFKIYVGAIDEQDVPAYVQQVANNFKRAPLIDPQTGQLDLRKGYSSIDADYFIPVRSENAPNPIDTLGSAQNPTQMDDIEYMKNKILAGLRVPKSFINYQEAQGKGQNLSILDVRFCRQVNRVQQFMIMELNKIAMIHLYLLGFEDELTNFSITMNNPSPQIEAQELEEISKRVQVAVQLLADSGNGIQMWSLHKVLKEIMKMTDKEIADNLNEIRLEKALAAELLKTEQIIKRTGLFDPIDNIYGEIGAEYQEVQPGQDGGMGGGAMGGGAGAAGAGGFGADLGGDIDDLGAPGADTSGDISGNSGSAGMGDAAAADAGTATMESRWKNKPILNEGRKFKKTLSGTIFETYMDKIRKDDETEREAMPTRVDSYSSNLLLNESTQNIIDSLSKKLDEIENGEDNVL